MSSDFLQGSCHCGAVRFEVRTPLEPASRCNCSLCRRKGALMSPAFPEADLHILSGEENLTCYQFNSRVARHYFCKHCGIYTFHAALTARGKFRVNIGCLEGIDPYALEATVIDGKSLPLVGDA
jgi:hypothetical protein